MVESTTAASFRPYDVTQFKSRDAAAAVLLANSLGWRVLPRSNGPTALVAEDGKQIRVPDNTGIKMDVFRGWVHQIAVHTDGVSITRKLIDEIVKVTKVNREHARLMYDLTEEAVPVYLVNEPEAELQGEMQPISFPVGEPYILTREPYKNSKGNETGSAYDRTWSDGHHDYECTICGVVFPHIKGVSSHRQWHIGRGEVPGKQIKRQPGKAVKQYGEKAKGPSKSKAAASERMVHMSEGTATDAIDALRVLEQIRSLVGSADEVQQLTADLNHAHERIARLEGNLKALRDLLGDV